MIPGVFEWMWDPGHVIFMGIVWAVLLILLSGVTYVVAKSVRDTLHAADRFDNPTLIEKSSQ